MDFKNYLDWENLAQELAQITTIWFGKLFVALLVLYIGWKIINKVIKGLRAIFLKVDLEASLESFLESLALIGLRILLLVFVASLLGVKTTSLIALLGAAGLAVGLSLQGALSNFAGGVLIMVFKPFKVDDHVKTSEAEGIVESIQIFNTVICTFNNERIFIPNGALANNTITNFSSYKNRRLSFVFNIGYTDDIEKAKKVVEKVVTENYKKLIVKDKPLQIVVGNLGESSVDIYCRFWVANKNFWEVYFDIPEKIKVAFDKNGISIPFPQRDVHVYYPEGKK